jgi:hypothetical protein
MVIHLLSPSDSIIDSSSVPFVFGIRVFSTLFSSICSFNVSVSVAFVTFAISIFHFCTVMFVLVLALFTQNIVHLTAAVESVVNTSNPESLSRCVALLQSVHQPRTSFTLVARLSSATKSS